LTDLKHAISSSGKRRDIAARRCEERNETATGAALHRLREALQAHEDERLRLIVSSFMVSAARVRAG
jgi:hypothetical protein